MIKTEQDLAKALDLLNRAADLLGEQPPDQNWWKEYLELTGEHAFLYDEGWEPGVNKKYYLEEDPSWQPYDEVNAP